MRTLLERTVGGPPVTVTVGDLDVPLNEAAGLVIRHGRSGFTGPPDPSSCTVYVRASVFDTLPDLGDPVLVELSTYGLAWLGMDPDDSARPRFSGNITDLVHSGGIDPIVGIIAVSKRAALARYGRIDIADLIDFPGDIVKAWLQDSALDDLDLDLGTFVGEQPAITLLDGTSDPNPEKALTSLVDQIALAGSGLAGELVEKRDGQFIWQGPSSRAIGTTPSVTLEADQLLIGSQASKDLSQLVNGITVYYGPILVGGGQNAYAASDPVSRETFGQAYITVNTLQYDNTFIDANMDALLISRTFPHWRMPLLTVELLRTVDDETTDLLEGTWDDQALDLAWDDLGDLPTWLTPAELWLPVVAALLRMEFSTLLEIGDGTGLPLEENRVWLEGWTESYTPSAWRLDLDVSAFANTATYPV